MNIIRFGKIDLIIPIFIYFLFLENYAIKDSKINDIFDVLMISIFYNFGSIFGIVFEIIIKYRVNQKNITRSISIKQSYIPLKKETQTDYKIIILYSIITLLDSSSSFLYFYGKNYSKSHKNAFSMDKLNKAVQIFLTCVFCYLILKSKLERYKIFGLITMLFGYILNFIFSIKYFKNFRYVYFLFELSNKCETALKETIEKYLMHSKYKSPYIILFIEGVAGNIILSIIVIIIVLTSKGDFSLQLYNNLKQYAIVAIVCIGHNCCRVILNMRTSPTHRIMADALYSFSKHFISLITRTSSNNLDFISVVIVCIGALIYNEIIIFKFCDLDIDTSNEINYRATKEISEVENLHLEEEHKSENGCDKKHEMKLTDNSINED